MEEKTKEYLSWLDSEIKIYEAYHDSKENKAWLAVTAYAPAVIYLGQFPIPSLPFCGRMALAVAFVLLGFSAFMFMLVQFRMRWKADCIVRGLRRAKGKLITSSPCEEHLNNGEHWPRFIQKEICTFEKERRWCHFDLVVTEGASYCVLFLATLIAIGSLFIVKN